MMESSPIPKDSRADLGAHFSGAPQTSDIRRARNTSLRIPNGQPDYKTTSVALSEESAGLIHETAGKFIRQLNAHYMLGVGVFPAADPSEAYYNNVYSRDAAHFAGNYPAAIDTRPALDSLRLILRYQKPNGELPYRIEREEFIGFRLSPHKSLRKFAKPAFRLLSKFKKTPEIPYYEGFFSAEDTIPDVIIAAAELFIHSPDGERFVAANFPKLQRAVSYFGTKTDSEDHLVISKAASPDWMDSLQRGGKLGGMNVLWARSLRLMEFISRRLGYTEAAIQYGDHYRRVRDSVLKTFYNPESGYFRAGAGNDRLETTASVFGALYLLNPVEAVKVEQTLKTRVKRVSGLANFDPPYPISQVRAYWRVMELEDYHNRAVWPWVTLQNIQVKIKIATLHPDGVLREQYRKESVEDLLDMANLFRESGGVYEIYQPDVRLPAIGNKYTPPKNFMGNMVSFISAYNQLKVLGLL